MICADLLPHPPFFFGSNDLDAIALGVGMHWLFQMSEWEAAISANKEFFRF
jgi:hypothetical protein